MKLLNSAAGGATALLIVFSAFAQNVMAADAFPASILNTATVALPSTGNYTDNNTDNNEDDIALALAYNVELTLSKTNGAGSYLPGGTGTYTIVVGNTGTTTAENVTVTDTLPSGVIIAEAISTCTASGTGSSCGTLETGTGAVDLDTFTFNEARIPTGTTLTYVLKVNFAADMSGNIINTATATDLPSTNTIDATDEDSAAPIVDLSIAKSAVNPEDLDADLANYIPGQTVIYKLVVSNAGPSNVVGAIISDSLPAGVTLSAVWTCTPDTGSTCSAASGGTVTGSAVDLTANIEAGDSVTILVPVVFDPDAGDYTP